MVATDQESCNTLFDNQYPYEAMDWCMLTENKVRPKAVKLPQMPLPQL